LLARVRPVVVDCPKVILPFQFVYQGLAIKGELAFPRIIYPELDPELIAVLFDPFWLIYTTPLTSVVELLLPIFVVEVPVALMLVVPTAVIVDPLTVRAVVAPIAPLEFMRTSLFDPGATDPQPVQVPLIIKLPLT
jgi:hypothetical protein